VVARPADDAPPSPPALTLIGEAAPVAPGSGWRDWWDHPSGYPARKALPGERRYFNAQFERMLFPAAGSVHRRTYKLGAGTLAFRSGATEARWTIDLIEHQQVELADGVVVGQVLCHMVWDGADSSAAELKALPELVGAMRRALLNPGDRMTFVGEEARDLGPARPLRALIALLGGGAPLVDPYVIVGAERPAGLDARQWRRALARGRSLKSAAEAIKNDKGKAERVEFPLGPYGICVLGRGAAYTPTAEAKTFSRAEVRYLRSYWAESLGIGLLQMASLEEVSGQLAALPDEAEPDDLEDLYTLWLAVRRRLWWTFPAATTEVPTELLRRLHQEARSLERFRDLDDDFEAYVRQQRRRSDQAQAAALANLQTWGAGLATSATLAGILTISLTGTSPSLAYRIIATLGTATTGLLVSLWVRAGLRPEDGGERKR
jgi:hypothetical protein